jgi:hypothetical protein
VRFDYLTVLFLSVKNAFVEKMHLVFYIFFLKKEKYFFEGPQKEGSAHFDTAIDGLKPSAGCRDVWILW